MGACIDGSSILLDLDMTFHKCFRKELNISQYILTHLKYIGAGI